MDHPATTAPPAQARGAPLAPPPDLPPTLPALIADRVAARPDRLLRSFGAEGLGRTETHGQLWERAGRIAGGLAAVGAGEGRPVVLLVQDLLDFVPALWACLRVGAMAVPLTGLAAGRELGRGDAVLRNLLARLGEPVVLFDPGFSDWARGAAEAAAGGPVPPVRAVFLPLAAGEAAAPLDAERPAAEPCCLVATSGSTGRVKLVALDQATILSRYYTGRPPLQTDPATLLSLMPLDGISGIGLAFLFDRDFIQLDLSVFAARPTRLLEAIEALGVTQMSLTSSLAAHLLKEAAREAETTGRRWNLGTLRFLGLGAEPVVPAVVRRLRAFLDAQGGAGVVLRTGYGTTETGGLVAGAELTVGEPAADAEAGADLGPCHPGVELRIVGPEGDVLREGDLGEVEALCPEALFSGYWGEPEATRAAFTADGWYRTGDLGTLRDGRLTLRGRLKDVLIVHGRKLSLAEIDAALQAGLDLAVRAYACAVHWPGEEAEGLVVVLVADAPEPGRLEALADEAAAVVARRFGLAPGRVLAVEPADLPVTGLGKIRRRALSADIQAGRVGTVLRHRAPSRADGPPAVASSTAPAERDVAAIWRAVLGLRGPLDPQADFFDLGGDSLSALALATRIGETFGGWIAPERFFANPTLATLERLVAGLRPSSAAPAAPPLAPAAVSAPAPAPAPLPWPLPDDLRSRQLSLIETWAGTRPTRDRLVAGLNVAGGKPPLFWVFQIEEEFRQLARHLGPDQPLYGLRSGSGVIRYHEDEIQTLALRYVHEIVETCPAGPVFLGGNCQGALIALPVAQHLLRRGRHVPLLVLMEWGFAPQPYGGRVLLLHGRDSLARHPDHRYRDPERLWWRLYRHHRRAEIPGGHAQFFLEENVGPLADTLTEAMARALAEPPLVPVRDAHRVELAVSDPPARMSPGEDRALALRLRNAGPFTWDGEAFGLGLRSVWIDRGGTVVAVDRGLDLPLPLRAGMEAELSLSVTAPAAPGAYDLVVDLVDEGGTWAPLSTTPPFRQAVTVAP